MSVGIGNHSEKAINEGPILNFSNGTVSVLKGISDAIIITDTEGCILFVNPAAEEMTGFSQKESLGKDLKVVFFLSGNDLTSKELILNLSKANPALVKAEYGILTDRSEMLNKLNLISVSCLMKTTISLALLLHLGIFLKI
jgi:PAS domain-containing protein